MATFFGENGGENAAISVLSILADFISNLNCAMRRHDTREELEKRKAAAAQKRQQIDNASSNYTLPKQKERSLDEDLRANRSALLGAIANRAREGPRKQISQRRRPSIKSNDEGLGGFLTKPQSTNRKKIPSSNTESSVRPHKQYSIVEHGGGKSLHIETVMVPGGDNEHRQNAQKRK